MSLFVLGELATLAKAYSAARTAKGSSARVNIKMLTVVLLGRQAFAADRTCEILQFEVNAVDMPLQVDSGAVDFAAGNVGAGVYFRFHFFTSA
jgi:hypothetical protein